MTDARVEIGATAYSPGVYGSVVNPETKLLLMPHAFEVMGVRRGLEQRLDTERS